MPPKPPSDAARERIRLIAEELDKLQKTKGWQLLMHQLSLEEAQAKEDLVYVKLTDVEKLEQLQREAKRYIWFRDTIHDLIAQGLDITLADQEPEEEDGRAEPEDGDGA